MEVKDRVAAVTGGAIGTGRAIALALARAGANVVICDIDEARARETVALAPPGSCRPVKVDVTDYDQLGSSSMT
jgi:NAD(P)-dependent dehydrogenase (short-subunit alcohol dehydrogenase family)